MASVSSIRKDKDDEERNPANSFLAAPDEAFLQKLRDVSAELGEIGTRREELNAQKTALEQGLAADYGVNVRAMRAAIRYCELTDEQKVGWDLTNQVVRKALGQPVQLDLFEAQVNKAVKSAEAKKRIAAAGAPSARAAADAAFQAP
jgi:hypothetical protein